MISAKFYEGLEAIVYIALNSGADPVSSKDICASQGKLPRHLEPTMQLFVHNKILKGTKGPKGGYTLAKEKRKITLAKIFTIFLRQKDDMQKNSLLNKKIITPLSEKIESNIITFLEKITIEDLCNQANDVLKVNHKSGDFNI